MTSPHQIYAPIVELGEQIDATLATTLFDAAENEQRLGDAANIAALPGLPAELSERCRTHRNAEVRAAWLSAPDRAGAEIDAALASDRADTAFKRIAASTANADLLRRIAARRSLAVQTAIGENPATPTDVLPVVLETMAGASKRLGKLLALRAAARPELHDALVVALVNGDRMHAASQAVRSVFSSPYVSHETLQLVLARAAAIVADHDVPRAHAVRDVLGFVAYRPGLTDDEFDTLAELDRRLSQMTTSNGRPHPHSHPQHRDGLTRNPASDHTYAALLDPDADPAQLLTSSDDWTLVRAATHPDAAADVAASALVRTLATLSRRQSNRLSYELWCAARDEALRAAFNDDHARAGQLLLGLGTPNLVSERNAPAGVPARALGRAALLAALENPTAAETSPYTWQMLLCHIDSIDEVLQMPMHVFTTTGKHVPAEHRTALSRKLADTLGTAQAYEALATLSSSEMTVGDMLEAVTLIAGGE